MATREKRRREHERGFTLVELLLVITILGIIVVVAIPSFTDTKSRGDDVAARGNVRAALSSVEAYYADRSTYLGMSRAALKAIDPNLQLSEEPIIGADGTRFCIESTHNGRPTSDTRERGRKPHSVTGPGGDIVPGKCPGSL